MTTANLIGCLFLLSSLFFFTRSPGWRFGYMMLSGALCFVGLLLVSRRRPRCSRRYLKRTKRSYIAAQMNGAK
jgi:hypothetical protein